MSDIDLITSNRINNLDNDLIDIRTSIETNYNQLLSELNSLRTELINADSVIQSDLNTKYNELLTKINNNYNTLNTSITNVASRVTTLETKVSTLESRKMIKETYKNGDNWYRIWTDGWIEQGGKVARGFTGTITFPKPHTAIPIVVCACVYNRADTFHAREAYPNTVTAKTFTITNAVPAGNSADHIKYYSFGF